MAAQLALEVGREFALGAAGKAPRVVQLAQLLAVQRITPPLCFEEIARLGEVHGAAGAAMAASAAGRLDMMGHNMMQETKGFGSGADDGERD